MSETSSLKKYICVKTGWDFDTLPMMTSKRKMMVKPYETPAAMAAFLRCCGGWNILERTECRVYFVCTPSLFLLVPSNIWNSVTLTEASPLIVRLLVAGVNVSTPKVGNRPRRAQQPCLYDHVVAGDARLDIRLRLIIFLRCANRRVWLAQAIIRRPLADLFAPSGLLMG